MVKQETPDGAGRRAAAAFVAAALALACLFGLAACGDGDKDALKGEWRVKDTQVTVVFTDTQWKMVQSTFDYTLDSGKKTITYTADGMSGSATYELSSDGKQLTLNEDDGNGGTKTTVFDKVSDDTQAQPSAGTSSDTSTGTSTSTGS